MIKLRKTPEARSPFSSASPAAGLSPSLGPAAPLTSTAAIAARQGELKERDKQLSSEQKRLEGAGVKPVAGFIVPRELAQRLVDGTAEQPAAFADPAVYLHNVICERQAIGLALEALSSRYRAAEAREAGERAEERMPGRDELMTRITQLIVELMRAVLELRKYDMETGTGANGLPGSQWAELNVKHSEAFLTRWVRMAVEKKWLAERELRALFKQAGILP